MCIRKIIISETENSTAMEEVNDFVREYQGKVIWFSGSRKRVKQQNIKSIHINKLKSLQNFEKVAVILPKKNEKSLSDAQKYWIEMFLQRYEDQENVAFIFDKPDLFLQWHIPYILENAGLIKADIILTAESMERLKDCYLNYYIGVPEDEKLPGQRFQFLVGPEQWELIF